SNCVGPGTEDHLRNARPAPQRHSPGPGARINVSWTRETITRIRRQENDRNEHSANAERSTFVVRECGESGMSPFPFPSSGERGFTWRDRFGDAGNSANVLGGAAQDGKPCNFSLPPLAGPVQT